MAHMLIEPFNGYRQRPTLQCWKHRKTMTVEWEQLRAVE